MNENSEAKVLKSIIEKVESKKQVLVMRAWFNPVLWFICAILFLISFQLYEHLNQPFVLVGVSALVGILIGSISILQNGEKAWPILKNHINMESLKERIDEINT